MDLTSDIVGTNPKYPKIVNHGAIATEDIKSYDNYPSDNNSVRVIPKLHEMWNHDTNLRLVPNVSVQPLGVRNAEDPTPEIIREAKKAMMAGLKGKEISEHLRSRFTSKHIASAKEQLAKLAEEQGLLGNVYIDASAFTSYADAEQFLNQHRNRLAKYIVTKNGTVDQNVISYLASRFHKNVVPEIVYGSDLYDHYKMHLAATGNIKPDYVIDSKESLRLAFLMEKPAPIAPTKKEAKVIPQDVMKEGLAKIAEKHEESARISSDELLIGKIRPVLEYAQSQLAKGKTASDVKEMLRSRFVMEDIRDAAKGLSVIACGKLNASYVDSLVSDKKITPVMAEELKRVAKRFPVKMATVPEYDRPQKEAGVNGFFYALTGKSPSTELDGLRKASVEALLKGIAPEKVQAKLLTKLSAEQAGKVMSEAVKEMNSVSAGVRANAPIKAKKELFPEKPEAINFGLFASELPDKEAAIKENQDLINFYQGAQIDVDVSASEVQPDQEVGELLNRDGMDSVL
jgi:hypothetical protein